MLDTFSIENFRLFRQIEMARLGRVNLLVGKNNSGKSALLEALEIYASNASMSTLRNLLADRDENWNDRNLPELQQAEEVPYRHLFRGHSLPNIGESGIALGPNTEPLKRIQLLSGAFQTLKNEDGSIRRKLLTASEFLAMQAEEQEEEDITFSLIVQDGGRIRRIPRSDQRYSVNRTTRISNHAYIVGHRTEIPVSSCSHAQYVPSEDCRPLGRDWPHSVGGRCYKRLEARRFFHQWNFVC